MLWKRDCPMLHPCRSTACEAFPKKLTATNADSLWPRYGVGIPTERAYFYKQGPFEHDEVQSGDIAVARCEQDSNCTTTRAPLDLPLTRQVWIDNTVSNESLLHHLSYTPY